MTSDISDYANLQIHSEHPTPEDLLEEIANAFLHAHGRLDLLKPRIAVPSESTARELQAISLDMLKTLANLQTLLSWTNVRGQTNS